MTPEIVTDLFREGLLLAVLMISMLIVPSLVVGLVISIFQAATQINEQTLSFLPRLLTTLMVLIVWGPFLLNKLMNFTATLISNLPYLIGQ